jgi:hypothetical protein
MQNEQKSKSRNKGTFVGGYVETTHLEKIETVERMFDEQFGEIGRNRTRAIRYIVDCFDPAWLKNFPKNHASKSMNAETNQ